MPPAGAALCIVAKLFSNSAWDHVGVVIRHPATGELLFLEADFGGVKLRSLTERVRRSKSNEIAVRKLSVVRSSSMREKFYAFAQDMIGRPYEIGTAPVIVRVADPLAKKERERLHALLIDKRAQVDEITKELGTAVLTSFQRKVLESERNRVQDYLQRIEVRLRKELEVNSPIEQLSDRPSTKDDPEEIFCSGLVAAAYQRVGLLESYPPAFHYSPKDWSSEQQHPPGVHLLKGARLGKESYLRRTARSPKESEDMSKKRSFRGVVEGDTPSKASRKQIKDALKRTPIYGMVADEYKRSHLVKTFRAKIVEAGDFVFEQGDYGDRLYVIGSGELERFTSKGDEDPILVSTLGPRTTFGLTAFTFNCPRVSTIRAKERTLLWELDRPTFELFKDTGGDIKSIVSYADTRRLRRILQDHFLFSRLDRLGPKELSAFFEVQFRAGETVFKQGDSGDNFYIIKSGELERHIRHPKRTRNGNGSNTNDRDEDEIASLSKTLKPGQSFGELSLMYNARRAATVRARTDAECWAISAESFSRLNLGGGTQYLRAIFDQNASIKRNGESYMTREDLLRFAGVDAFPDKDRERLANLLVALVASNRAKEPFADKDEEAILDGKNDDLRDSSHDEEDDEILMDFWEFVRFDIILNQPAAETNFAFRLADQDNSGFISLDDMQSLLQTYVDVDESANSLLSQEASELKRYFGRDGTKLLSARDFQQLSETILPPLFRKDVSEVTEHMLNIDVEVTDAFKGQSKEEVVVESDGAISVVGSQFVGYKRRNGTLPTDFAGKQNFLPTWSQSQDWVHLLSVGITGAIARTAVAPLERLKILMQAGGTKSFSNGWVPGFIQMTKQDTSLVKALFRGNGANILRSVPHSAVTVLVIAQMNEFPGMRKLTVGRERAPSAALPGSPSNETSVRLVSGGTRTRAAEAVFAGGIAAMVAAAVTYPLEFVRGRLSLQRQGFEPYRGAFHGIAHSVRSEGLRSIYRGLGPTLLGCFPFAGITFAMYETVRPILPKKNDGSGMPTTGSAIMSGALATATSQLAVFPIDTCRRRMQVAGFDPRSSATAIGFKATWKEIGREMGWKGYFRGVFPNLLKVLPSSAISLLAYEHVRSSVEAAQNGRDKFIKSSFGRART